MGAPRLDSFLELVREVAKVLLAIVDKLPLQKLSAGQAVFLVCGVILAALALAIVSAGVVNSPGALLMYFGLMLFLLVGLYGLWRTSRYHPPST